MSDFAAILQGLTAYQRELEDAARRAMDEAARELEGVAAASTAYRDDTGATRAATTAYVATARGGGRSDIRSAAATVRRLRFDDGQDLVEEVEGPTGANLMIVLTVPTAYQIDLEERRAGEQSVVRAALLAEAGGIMATIAREQSEVHG